MFDLQMTKTCLAAHHNEGFTLTTFMSIDTPIKCIRLFVSITPYHLGLQEERLKLRISPTKVDSKLFIRSYEKYSPDRNAFF